MTDIEISKALALAIGWEENDDDPDVQIVWSSHPCEDAKVEVWFGNHWHEFDYRDWAVIGPIAERYKCFPFQDPWYKWIAGVGGYPKVFADTPQKAIALAVIGAKG